jgi:hypothetical protein
MQSVNSLVAGLQQVKDEMRQLQQLRTSPAEDQFVHVMQVYETCRAFRRSHTYSSCFAAAIYGSSRWERRCTEEDGHIRRIRTSIAVSVLWRKT